MCGNSESKAKIFATFRVITKCREIGKAKRRQWRSQPKNLGGAKKIRWDQNA